MKTFHVSVMQYVVGNCICWVERYIDEHVGFELVKFVPSHSEIRSTVNISLVTV